MASNTEFVKSVLLLDGTQVSQVLADLDTKAKKLGDDMVKALQAGDKATYTKLSKELKQVETSMSGIKKGAFDVQNVLKNLNGTNMKDLQRAQRSISAEMSTMTRNTKEYISKSVDLQKVESELRKIKVEMHGVSNTGEGMWSKMATGMNKYWMAITTGIATFTGVILGFKKLVTDFDAFEQKVAELSSITGVSGDELKYLSDKAKDLSTSVTDTGVKITKSADDIVDGFKLMGSARPELLKNKEALAEVTKNALTLAEAATIEMAPAVDAVAASMNQFNLGASESNRIINVMGAGALEGSAEIADLTESLGTVGTVANNSNMTLEQTVATLEVLGAKQLKGAEAGTQLKTSLISLKAAGLGYSSGIFNMRDAIVELKAKMDAKSTALEKDTVLIDVFGKRNITVGTILTQNIDSYDKLTKAVTGTNVAVEQAITNTSTNSAKLEQAKNRAHLMALELGEKLAPAMTFSTNAFMYFLKAIMATIKFFNEYKTAILSVTIGIAAYTIAIKATAILTGIFDGVLKVVTTTMKLFNTATKANPLAILISVLAAAAVALALYKSKMDSATKAQQGLTDATVEAQKRMLDEANTLESLLKIAKDETLSKEERQKAMEKINKISPEYLGNLKLEEINTDKATEALKKYIESLEKKYKIEVLQEKIKEEQGKQLDTENSKLEDNISWYEKVWNAMKSGGNAAIAVTKNLATANDNKNESLQESKDIVGVYKTELENLLKTTDNAANSITGETDALDGNTASTDKLKDAYEKLNDKISDYDKKIKALVVLGKITEAAVMAQKLTALKKEKEGYDNIIASLEEYYTYEEKYKKHQDEAAKYNAEREKGISLSEQEIDRETLLKTRELALAKGNEKEILKVEVNAIEEKLENEKLSNEEREKLEIQLQDKLFEIKKFGAEQDIELAKQTADKKLELEKDLAAAKDNFIKKSIDTAATLANIANNAQYNKDIAALNAKYEADKARLEKQGLSKEKYDARLAVLDKKKAKEESKLKSKQAKIEAAIALAKIATDTAVAIAKINAIAAALAAGVATAPLAAVALAQIPWVLGSAALEAGVVVANAAIPQYKTGGDTGSGSDSTPVGVVHANEYVIPAWERRIPQVMAMESIIEGIRMNKGFMGGGGTSANTVTNNTMQTMFSDPRLVSALEKFNEQVSGGIMAKFVFSQFEDVKSKVDETRSNFGA